MIRQPRIAIPSKEPKKEIWWMWLDISHNSTDHYFHDQPKVLLFFALWALSKSTFS
jgi:hypothetical protein